MSIIIISFPKQTHPTVMSDACKLYLLNEVQYDTVRANLQKKHRDAYLEPCGGYIDHESLKKATGLATVRGIQLVSTDDRPETKNFPNRLLSYNKDYIEQWGNQPIYGNVFVCLSKKAYATVPVERRVPDEDLLKLEFQPDGR